MHFQKIGVRLGIYGLYFQKIGIKSGIHFGKIDIRIGYVFEASMARPPSNIWSSSPPGAK